MNQTILDLLRHWTPILIAVVLLGGGIANLIAPPTIRTSFSRWGYPPRFYYITGALELAAAVLTYFEATRIYGFLLAVLILVAAIATLVRHREINHSVPALVILLLIGFSLWV